MSCKAVMSILMSVMSVTAVKREAAQPVRGHGDPCGFSPDTSLECCIGVTQSTLIYRTETCCNGIAVGQNELCCSFTVPEVKGSPDHDSCCLNPDTQRGNTFDSRDHYCNPQTGDVLPIPNLSSLLNPSLLRHTSFDSWCRAGNVQEASEGPLSDGESVRCCGIESYFASRQTCCAGVLHDVPEAESQCCYDVAYRLGDSRNPCLGQCGGRPLNTANQLCCDQILHPSTSFSDRCCGTHKIAPETHLCCGGVVMLRGGPHKCCRETLPFLRRYMRCNRDGRLSRKSRGQFQAHALCRRLSTWERRWPDLRLAGSGDSELAHIEGYVSSVKKSQRDKVQLNLHPFHIISSPSSGHHAPMNSTCLERQSTIRLTASLGSSASQRRCRGRQLRRYLMGANLMVFFPLNALRCSDGSVAAVNVPADSGEHLILKKSSQ